MHPRQANLITAAQELVQKLATKEVTSAAVLWKYTDPEGHEFYLTEKKMTVKSPYSGKSFTTKPEKQNMGAVTKELREESLPAGAGPGGKTTTKRKRASEEWKVSPKS